VDVEQRGYLLALLTAGRQDGPGVDLPAVVLEVELADLTDRPLADPGVGVKKDALVAAVQVGRPKAYRVLQRGRYEGQDRAADGGAGLPMPS